ncbi:FAD-dependent oxidoreductase [Cohnella sp.]|uniref:FAD-dependent oxidoreductase n=1 Tax=Cohnella sp. TaxID=1883426 RepID=UPI0035621D74
MKKGTLYAILIVLAVVLGVGGWVLLSGSQEAAPNQAPAPAAKPEPETKVQHPAAPAEPPKPVIPEEKVDIVLVGSEMEGMYLARAAADEGLKVVIIDPAEGVGGQLLQAEMLFLDETKDDAGRSLVQGRVKELFDGFKAGSIRKTSEYEKYFADKLAKGIPIESGVKIDKVETAPGTNGKEKVVSVVYTGKDGKPKKLTASHWVENTDHAALASKLKTVRLPGLESVYGLPTIEYMASGYMMKFKNIDWNRFVTHFNSLSDRDRANLYGVAYVNDSFAIALTDMVRKYTASDELVFLRGLNAVYQRDGEVLINALLVYDVDPSKPESVKVALERVRKELPMIRDHFRKHIVGWEKAEINGYPNHLYVREYNHYETDHVLQVSDALGGKMFWDNVSIAGYPLDLQGTKSVKWGIEMGRPDKYGMPLRSFLLKSYDNVIMAGKNVGASAVAYGSARIQPNTALAAESIGVLIKQLGGAKTLAQVDEADMKQLHATLASKYNIRLTGVTGANKISGWSEAEIAKLNEGSISYPAYVRTR